MKNIPFVLGFLISFACNGQDKTIMQETRAFAPYSATQYFRITNNGTGNRRVSLFDLKNWIYGDTIVNSSGGGVKIYKGKNGNTYSFKRIKAGANVSVTDGGDSIIVSASLSGGGNPAGTFGQIQYNNSGVFGADTDLYYNPVTEVFAIGRSNGASTMFKVIGGAHSIIEMQVDSIFIPAFVGGATQMLTVTPAGYMSSQAIIGNINNAVPITLFDAQTYQSVGNAVEGQYYLITNPPPPFTNFYTLALNDGFGFISLNPNGFGLSGGGTGYMSGVFDVNYISVVHFYDNAYDMTGTRNVAASTNAVTNYLANYAGESSTISSTNINNGDAGLSDVIGYSSVTNSTINFATFTSDSVWNCIVINTTLTFTGNGQAHKNEVWVNDTCINCGGGTPFDPATCHDTGSFKRVIGCGDSLVLSSADGVWIHSVPITKSALLALAGSYGEDVTYRITDAANTYCHTSQIWVKAIDANTLDLANCVRVMNVPFSYADGADDGTGAKITGIWNSTILPTYGAGSLSIWGGRVWINLTAATGTAIDDITLDATNWSLRDQATFPYDYINLQFGCSYDLVNDWVNKQWDDKGNVFGVDYLYDQYNYGFGFNFCDVADWNFETNGNGYPYANNICDGAWNNISTGFLNNKCTGIINDCNFNGVIAWNQMTSGITSSTGTGGFKYNNTSFAFNGNSFVGNAQNITSNFLEYKVLLSQSSTSAPVATVLFDNLSASVGGITFNYSSAGQYNAQRGDATNWTNAKTEVTIGSANTGSNSITSSSSSAYLANAGDTRVFINTSQLGISLGVLNVTGTNGLLNNTVLDIKVYF